MKEKIWNYKQLNNVIIETIKTQDHPVTAKEIESKILSKYSTGKIKFNPKSISGRIRGNPHIRVTKGNKINFYEFCEF